MRNKNKKYEPTFCWHNGNLRELKKETVTKNNLAKHSNFIISGVEKPQKEQKGKKEKLNLNKDFPIINYEIIINKRDLDEVLDMLKEQRERITYLRKYIEKLKKENSEKDKKIEELKENDVDYGTLYDWFIRSVKPEIKPVWTEEHIKELLEDFNVRWKK